MFISRIITIPHILWIPKVHCDVHDIPPLDPILIHITVFHALSSCSLQIHFNIILPPTPSPITWPLQVVPAKLCLYLAFPRIRATCPSHH